MVAEAFLGCQQEKPYNIKRLALPVNYVIILAIIEPSQPIKTRPWVRLFQERMRLMII